MWVIKQSFIKDMNDVIKLKWCNYVNICGNMLTNQDLKSLYLKKQLPVIYAETNLMRVNI